VVTFADDPARTVAVSWRTEASVTATEAQIARATPDARFDLAATTTAAVTTPLDLAQVPMAAGFFNIADNAGLAPVAYHSVVFTGLEPDTLYAYRVRGAGNRWSEWFQVRTAPLRGPVTFLYLGDAQNGILSHWARVVRAAYAAAPEARFILHAGDLVDRGSRDFEWAQWFRAVGFIHGMVPAMPVAGNHEYMRVGDGPTAQRMLSMLWRPQFALPERPELPPLLQETVYDVRYSQDLHVFVLDTQGGDLPAQAAWLDRQLAATDAPWTVVAFHHPVFSSGGERDDVSRRTVLLPVLQRRDVDLVLQGHDHTYARGALQPDSAPQTPERVARRRAGGAVGPMFVNSVSGAKQYRWRENRWDDYADEGVTLDRRAENTQFFQVIRIDGNQLRYQAFTADGQLYDSFVLSQDARGRRRMVEGQRSTLDERRFTGTMPYPGTDGLND
jgi:3',5'-cyclic AMP phosphodiesterase CpdA